MNDKIEWIEKQATENLKFRLKIHEALAKDANNFLTILLAAIGAIVAYAIKSANECQINPLFIGSMAMMLWLIVIATILMVMCIITSPIIPPGNEPDNLLLDNYTLDEIRKFELKNVQYSINVITVENQKTAYWLDKVRLAFLISPIVFIIVEYVSFDLAVAAFEAYKDNLCALALEV